MWNRVLLHAWPVIELHPDEVRALIERLAPRTAGLGIELIAIQGRLREEDGTVHDRVLRFYAPTGHDVSVDVADPPSEPLQPLDEGARRITSARRRGTLHPAEIVKLLAPAHPNAGQPSGEFIEHELTDGGRLEPVERPPATNPTGIVVGTVRNFTERYPEGMLRVILLGDPTRALGSLAEPECRRIVAAIDLAEQLGVPLEWFALSAGAKIAMDSGTETMDWIAAGLRRIVLFTQAGGELNVVVAGINVGAQPYCNAEATMLMHTPRCADHDAGRRDGAGRQADARLLGRRVGRGQPGDRGLRADHGAQRPGAVLGERSRRRLPGAASLLRTHLRGAG